MIQIQLQVTIITIALLFFIIVWQLVRYGKLRPAYGLLWLMFSLAFVIISFFRGVVFSLADILDITHTSLIFGIGLFFTIILLLNQSVIISFLSRNNKELAQNYAILQWRLEQLEQREYFSEDAE
ncbi:MAG: hypothetical protein A2Z49_08375 [Chloroflexi bacterium RBG_19FT_COMBO_56_12]|nr:MAG: hypothetical protein A2Z49_08375 [Chloroflexi bacterium RBG_19FT_COMBO_56_12]